jgi:hypothetical protein
MRWKTDEVIATLGDEGGIYSVFCTRPTSPSAITHTNGEADSGQTGSDYCALCSRPSSLPASC